MSRKTFFGPIAFGIIAVVAALSFFQQPTPVRAAECPPDEAHCDGGGIPPTFEPPGPTPPRRIPPREACPDDSLSVGEIHVAAQKIAPAFPLVIGQDETRRGADIRCQLSIDPTLVTTYSHDDQGHCVRHTAVYAETATAEVQVSLSQSSRDWILSGDLQTRYPGAYLHNPDFTAGACNGLVNAQVADPGIFNLTVSGQTSGTPVNGPRPFALAAGEFKVYLREEVIVR